MLTFKHEVAPNVMKQEDYREFVCGFGAAAVNVSLTFPINKVIFRQMLHGVGVRSAVRQLKREGFFTMYRGVLPPLLQKSLSTALMFGTYDQIYRHLCQYTKVTSPPNFAVHYSFIWIAAATSAGVECLLTPFERIQTLLQDPDYHSRFQNTFHAAKNLYSYNLCEYYRGLSAIYIRNFLSTGIFFSLREPIAAHAMAFYERYVCCDRKRSLSGDASQSEKLSTTLCSLGFAHFCSGALLGAISSTLFYPTNVIRARMQSYVGGRFLTIHHTWRLIRAERKSFFAMWKGVPLNFSRSLLSWGIINATYELIKAVFFPNRTRN